MVNLTDLEKHYLEQIRQINKENNKFKEERDTARYLLTQKTKQWTDVRIERDRALQELRDIFNNGIQGLV